MQVKRSALVENILSRPYFYYEILIQILDSMLSNWDVAHNVAQSVERATSQADPIESSICCVVIFFCLLPMAFDR